MTVAAHSDAAILSAGKRTLALEAGALQTLSEHLSDVFVDAVRTVLACQGRVVVCGLGKTGHIARKLAATFASTGTPALFMHAAEALHGDLGMLTDKDVLLALSHSGSGHELLTILPIAKRLNVPVIAMTGHPDSELAKLSNIHLHVQVDQEACPLNLAPTTSTTAALALGDALAVATLQARGFNEEDFARAHPGGALGRRLLTRVKDVMRQSDALPTVTENATVAQALLEISNKGMGMTAVLDSQGRAIGIFTDGDLRRLIESQGDIRQVPIVVGMSPSPQHISADVLAVQAASIMDEGRISQLLVANESGQLVGALHMHDLMTAKVI